VSYLKDYSKQLEIVKQRKFQDYLKFIREDHRKYQAQKNLKLFWDVDYKQL